MTDPEDYVEQDGRTVNVLDLLNPHMPRAGAELRAARLSTCRTCPHRVGPGTRCGICSCWMPAKTWLLDASCPERRWTA